MIKTPMVLIAAVAFITIASPDTLLANWSVPKVEKRTRTLVNAFRKQKGLKLLKQHSKIRNAAIKHSQDMKARNFFAHINPSGKSPGDRITPTGYKWRNCGENLAANFGTKDPAKKAFTDWKKSKPHRVNMLKKFWREDGMGIIIGNKTFANFGGNGKNNWWLFTHKFARPAKK